MLYIAKTHGIRVMIKKKLISTNKNEKKPRRARILKGEDINTKYTNPVVAVIVHKILPPLAYRSSRR